MSIEIRESVCMVSYMLVGLEWVYGDMVWFEFVRSFIRFGIRKRVNVRSDVVEVQIESGYGDVGTCREGSRRASRRGERIESEGASGVNDAEGSRKQTTLIRSSSSS